VPIYDYACKACGHLTEVVHGIHDHGPKFCPECGAEGTMTKAFALPTIHFKGSGWAKKDRSASSRSSSSTKDEAAKPAPTSTEGGSSASTTSGADSAGSSTSGGSSTPAASAGD
jgi:putative FmdB family regulatory protein